MSRGMGLVKGPDTSTPAMRVSGRARSEGTGVPKGSGGFTSWTHQVHTD